MDDDYFKITTEIIFFIQIQINEKYYTKCLLVNIVIKSLIKCHGDFFLTIG